MQSVEIKVLKECQNTCLDRIWKLMTGKTICCKAQNQFIHDWTKYLDKRERKILKMHFELWSVIEKKCLQTL